MTLKHVLKHFSKTEVQEDERFSLAPMREREELLCERSELSNSGEGYISCVEHTVTVFSPFTSHFSQLCLPSPDATRHPLPREGKNALYAKHTEKNLFTYLPIHLFTFRKAAFTLAEVLITLGIIGVVAALTLPTLIQNHKKQTYVNQLKKVVNTLENAAQMAVAQEGVSSFYDTKVYSRFMDYYTCSGSCVDITEDIVNSLNIKYVSIDKSNKDYSSDYKEFDGSAQATGLLKNPVSIVDGSILYFWDGYITVDINGKKAPNQIGRDTFHLGYNYYNNKGLLTDYSYDCLNAEENSYLEQGCYLKKIVADGWKMNY